MKVQSLNKLYNIKGKPLLVQGFFYARSTTILEIKSFT